MRFGFDVDGTICHDRKEGESYEDVLPFPEMINFMHELKQKDHYIILHTARGMGSRKDNLGKINAEVSFGLLKWLEKHNVPYDELYLGKPHCDIFIDDKAYNPKGKDIATIKQEIETRLGPL